MAKKRCGSLSAGLCQLTDWNNPTLTERKPAIGTYGTEKQSYFIGTLTDFGKVDVSDGWQKLAQTLTRKEPHNYEPLLEIKESDIHRLGFVEEGNVAYDYWHGGWRKHSPASCGIIWDYDDICAYIKSEITQRHYLRKATKPLECSMRLAQRRKKRDN